MFSPCNFLLAAHRTGDPAQPGVGHPNWPFRLFLRLRIPVGVVRVLEGGGFPGSGQGEVLHLLQLVPPARGNRNRSGAHHRRYFPLFELFFRLFNFIVTKYSNLKNKQYFYAKKNSETMSTATFFLSSFDLALIKTPTKIIEHSLPLKWMIIN